MTIGGTTTKMTCPTKLEKLPMVISGARNILINLHVGQADRHSRLQLFFRGAGEFGWAQPHESREVRRVKATDFAKSPPLCGIQVRGYPLRIGPGSAEIQGSHSHSCKGASRSWSLTRWSWTKALLSGKPRNVNVPAFWAGISRHLGLEARPVWVLKGNQQENRSHGGRAP